MSCVDPYLRMWVASDMTFLICRGAFVDFFGGLHSSATSFVGGVFVSSSVIIDPLFATLSSYGVIIVPEEVFALIDSRDASMDAFTSDRLFKSEFSVENVSISRGDFLTATGELLDKSDRGIRFPSLTLTGRLIAESMCSLYESNQMWRLVFWRYSSCPLNRWFFMPLFFIFSPQNSGI